MVFIGQRICRIQGHAVDQQICQRIENILFPFCTIQFHYGAVLFFCPGKNIAPRDLHQNRQTDGLGKTADPLIFILQLPLVVDDARDPFVFIAVKVPDAAQNIISCIKRHIFTTRHQEYCIRVFPSYRHCKAAAYDIAKHVIEDAVILLQNVMFSQIFKGGDDAAAGTADTWFWTACLYAADLTVRQRYF